MVPPTMADLPTLVKQEISLPSDLRVYQIDRGHQASRAAPILRPASPTLGDLALHPDQHLP